MAFLNPLLLFGTAAIAAPIIIHLFFNRRVKKMAWAAMRFLENSVVKNRKRLRVEDILLLALRCLLLVLLALALARPIFGGAGNAAMGRGSEVAVIALDNSYSMGQNDGGPTRLDQARQAAEQIVDGLPSGSSVAVLLFSDLVNAVVPEPTYDLNLARKVIRGAKLSSRPTNVQPVLTQAVETLTRRGGAGASIYLITDGQASGWAALGEIRKTLASPAITSRLILVGGPEEHNLAVSDLRLASAIAAVGTAAQFEVEVTNFGVSEARAVSVKLSIDREAPSDEGAIETIPAAAAKRLSLYAKFRTPGYHTVTARIAADHLPADDQRTVALRAVDDVRVLLVDGDPGTEPRAAETFYLRNALTPVPPEQRERYFVKTKTIAPADLTSTKLTDYEAVVLANVANLTPTAVEGIIQYLHHGGGLIIFPGDRTVAAFYNETFGKKLLLPAALGAIRGEADKRDNSFALQAKDYTNRIVSIWNDPGAGSLGTVQFFRAFDLTPLPGHNADAGEPDVVLKYADGKPAVVERSWGRGRVILFSSTADTAWNDFGLHPSFVPLVARSLGAILDRQDARLNLPVGGMFEFVGDPDWVDRDAIIVAPGESKESGSLRRIGMLEGFPLLRFEDTAQAGAYGVSVKTEPASVVKFAAQFDASESNLADLRQEQLDTLAPATQVIRWNGTGPLDLKGAKGGGGGSEWWRTLAALALIVACVESALGAVFSSPK
jgi:hypothetical protein